MKKNSHVVAAALAACVSLHAQSPIVYNAARGSLPSAQCFVHGWSAPLAIVGGELHVGPTPTPNGLYFTRSDFPYDFDAGFFMEATFRVVSSGCSQNPQGSPRYGVQLSASDNNGSYCAAQFCSTGVVLVNTPNGVIDGINVVSAPYPVAGQTLVARVEVDANQCRLFINNAPVLSVVRGTYVAPGREFYFGDGTNQTGSEFFLSALRASGSASGCTPTSVVNVASGCAGLGTLAFSGIVQPGQPASATFAIPGASLGGVPLMLVGPYAMQVPYCGAGCRFGLDPTSAIVVVTDAVTVLLPAMSAFVGWPIAFQGARVGIAGPCATPVIHSLTDVSVMTL